METTTKNSLMTPNKSRSLNIFIVDSQKETFSNEISSLLPKSILIKEEANENSGHKHISKYFFEKAENRYNVINLTHLDSNSILTKHFFSSNKISDTLENNFFIIKIDKYPTESEFLDIFSTVFGQDIFKTFIFKEIVVFFEEKKQNNFPSLSSNLHNIEEEKNFENFKKKICEMNLS
jgi:hypothetical protein